MLRWERTTRSLETPDLAPAGSPPRGRVYEIDVRVAWEAKRQVEIRTLRMTTPQTTELIATPTAPGTPASKGGTPTPPTSPFGGLGGARR